MISREGSGPRCRQSSRCVASCAAGACAHPRACGRDPPSVIRDLAAPGYKPSDGDWKVAGRRSHASPGSSLAVCHGRAGPELLRSLTERVDGGSSCAPHRHVSSRLRARQRVKARWFRTRDHRGMQRSARPTSRSCGGGRPCSWCTRRQPAPVGRHRPGHARSLRRVRRPAALALRHLRDRLRVPVGPPAGGSRAAMSRGIPRCRRSS